MYVWPFVTAMHERVKGTKFCETKNCEVKVCKLNLQNCKNCLIKDGEWAHFITFIYLRTLFYFGIKSHKIEYTFKMYD